MSQLVNLKQFRQRHNLTQTAAAEGIGIDQRQWNRYENGKNEISVRYLRDICVKYKVSADWLLGLIEEGGNDMDKLKEYYDKVIYIINWAEYQDHITDEAAGILLANLEDAYLDIQKTESQN